MSQLESMSSSSSNTIRETLHQTAYPQLNQTNKLSSSSEPPSEEKYTVVDAATIFPIRADLSQPEWSELEEKQYHVTPNEIVSRELSCQDRTPGEQVLPGGKALQTIIEKERADEQQEDYVDMSIDPNDLPMLEFSQDLYQPDHGGVFMQEDSGHSSHFMVID